MTISYTRPLEHSWERMKAVLFRKPFPIEAWFVMGLGAWLADLLTSNNGSAGLMDLRRATLGEVASRTGDFLASPTTVAVVLAGLLMIAILLLVVVVGFGAGEVRVPRERRARPRRLRRALAAQRQARPVALPVAGGDELRVARADRLHRRAARCPPSLPSWAVRSGATS
ncbi:MAG: hypothetical protein IPJ04_02470 [Candidatus Eisenbacteria bacterium]|nr:hypothetical protein [Candidatus Eisenbacteria bacterium]